MVEDRITDGRRIAELLASEISGAESGPLAQIRIVEADPDAKPSVDGTPAYGISTGGRNVGSVVLFPDYARVTLSAGIDSVVRTAADVGVPARIENDTAIVRVESGAAVKRAVDVVAAAIAE